MRDAIPAPEVEELKKLYRQLPHLLWEASVGIKPDPGTGELFGHQLERFRRKDSAVNIVVERIRQILDA